MTKVQEININQDVDKLMSQADNIIGNTIRNVNYELINMYWRLGKIITDYKVENNSKYGDAVVARFNNELSLKYGEGFSRRNII